MKNKIKSLSSSFAVAMRGVNVAVKGERNMRIHLCFFIYVIFFGIIGKVTNLCWGILFLCFAAVFCAELVNTAVEKLCDTVCPEYNPLIGMVKDLSAGAVLVAAICSAAAGLFIFLSQQVFWQIISVLFIHWWLWIVIAASLVAAFLFIFRDK